MRELKRRIIPIVSGAAAAVLLLGLCARFALAEDKRELPPGDQCIICHMEEESMPEGFLDADIHMQVGLSCAGCHGGDPTKDDEDEAMNEDIGFVGVPDRDEIPQMCGKCHSDINFMRRWQPRIATDQVSQYYTSVHGKKLREGDRKVAECASCHTAHAILPARDTRSTTYALNVPGTCKHCHADPSYMADYNIRTTQYEDYARGVHGVALLEKHDTGSPACNDCHGNHGATPPEVSSLTQVCGQCHVNNARYFEETVMAQEFAKEELHACEECHGNHNIRPTFDAMVGITDEAVCLDCHDEGDDGYKAAAAIGGKLDSLVTRYDFAVTEQQEVRRIGMDDVEIAYLLQEAHQHLIQARTLVHTFDPEQVGVQTSQGLEKADKAVELAAAQFTESRVRRRGLGVATLFITLLVIALWFKVRDMEGGGTPRTD